MSFAMTKTGRLVLVGSVVLVLAMAAAVLAVVIAAREGGPAATSGGAAQPCIRDATGKDTGNVCAADDDDLEENGCAQDVYSDGEGLTCTSKEVVATVESWEGPDACISGEDAILPSIDLRFDPNGRLTRYDVGMFISIDGDPNGDSARTGTCLIGVGPILDDQTLTPAQGFPDVDLLEHGISGDTCGDVYNGNPIQYTIEDITVKCIDADGNGYMDVPICLTWEQPGDNELCLRPSDTEPGTKSKCNCDPIEIPIIVNYSGFVEVIKYILPDSAPGALNLFIDGSEEFTDAGDGDRTGPVRVSAGDSTDPGALHGVSETGGTETSLDDYNSSVLCQICTLREPPLDSLNPETSGPCVQFGDDVVPTTPGTSARFTVDPDQDIVCTFTNTHKGTLEVRKVLEPPDRSQWDIDVSGPSGFQDTLGHGGTTGAQTVDAGLYTIDESGSTAAGTDENDYTSSYACTVNGQAVPSGDGREISVGVRDGQTVVCTFTNTRKTGFLTIIKDLVPDLDPGLFNLQIDGVTDPDAENVGDGGSTGQQEVNAGTHTVGETAGTGTSLDDYDITISCVDENGQGSQVASSSDAGPLDVDVGENDNIVCTITNVIRVVPPDGGVDLPARVIIDGLAAVGTALLLAGVYLRHKMLPAG